MSSIWIKLKALISPLAKFFSRKLLFCMFSVFAMMYGLTAAPKLGYADSVLMFVAPTFIISITVICVTYITGLAKIDIQASANINK